MKMGNNFIKKVNLGEDETLNWVLMIVAIHQIWMRYSLIGQMKKMSVLMRFGPVAERLSKLDLNDE